MKKRRLWTLGIGSVVAVFIFVACGGGGVSTSAPARDSTAKSAQAGTPAPPAASEPAEGTTSRPAQPGDGIISADSSPASLTGYTWEVTTIDDNGAKPALVVDANGVPHVAYMLEDMPGFVNYAVLGDGAGPASCGRGLPGPWPVVIIPRNLPAGAENDPI